MNLRNLFLTTTAVITGALTSCQKDKDLERVQGTSVNMPYNQLRIYATQTGATTYHLDSLVFKNIDGTEDHEKILDVAPPAYDQYLGRIIDINRGPDSGPAIVDSNDPMISSNNPDSMLVRVGNGFNKTFMRMNGNDTTVRAPSANATIWMNASTHSPGIGLAAEAMNYAIGGVNNKNNTPVLKQ